MELANFVGMVLTIVILGGLIIGILDILVVIHRKDKNGLLETYRTGTLSKTIKRWFSH